MILSGMTVRTSLVSTVIDSPLLVLTTALAMGLLLPAAQQLSPWSTVFLQIIFFFSSLKIAVADVARHAVDWKLLVVANAMMLVGLPLVTSLLAQALAPDVRVALVLLAAMPAGMTAPLLVELVGGDRAQALVLSVVSSLLCPITIPVVTALATPAAMVTVDPMSMLTTLIGVICVPFLGGLVVRRCAPGLVERINPHTKRWSLVLLGLLVAGVVAAQAQPLLASAHDGSQVLRTLGIMFGFFVLLHALAYAACWWKPAEQRQSLVICTTYMNFTLAIFLAGRFFPRSTILLPLVLSVVPWTLLLPAWKRVSELRWRLDVVRPAAAPSASHGVGAGSTVARSVGVADSMTERAS